MNQFDVISIGDVVTDAFIRLFNENAQVVENDKGKWLAMPLWNENSISSKFT